MVKIVLETLSVSFFVIIDNGIDVVNSDNVVLV